VDDPSGVKWETFFTFGEATAYGENEPVIAETKNESCCGSQAPCCA
jgi:hypothetical protein